MRELEFVLEYEPGHNRVADTLAAVEDAFLSSDYYTDCLSADHCGATQRTQVLESTEDMLVLYSYWERTDACASVPQMALEHLGQGVLFETRKQGRQDSWRIVHPARATFGPSSMNWRTASPTTSTSITGS